MSQISLVVRIGGGSTVETELEPELELLPLEPLVDEEPEEEDDAVLSSSLSATAVFVRRGLSFTPPGLPPRGLILMPSMVLCFADVYVCCWRTFVATAAARWGVMVLGCVLGCTRR
jgi:hypothetical protein